MAAPTICNKHSQSASFLVLMSHCAAAILIRFAAVVLRCVAVLIDN